MKLSELLLSGLGRRGEWPDIEVTGVVQDHRLVRPGSLFIARSGTRFDGRNYLAAARSAGAVAAVAEPSPLITNAFMPVVTVPSAADAIAPLAAAFHGWPARSMTVAGVTGTDGKTSTSLLLHHLLSGTFRTGLLSTVAVLSGERPLEDTYFTTPEATEVQARLAAMRADGCTHVVVEASSHGLAAGRLDAIDFDIGVWTNLTREHLDFHGTMEGYRDAKALLLRRAKHAVLNRDDPWYGDFSGAAAAGHADFGLTPGQGWWAEDVTQTPSGLGFTVHTPTGSLRAAVPMLGAFNVLNSLAALAAATRLGVDEATAVGRLATFGGVPGRMQVVQSEPFAVIVDFAHTAAALTKAIAAARTVTDGRILLITGAAGERDRGKRGDMGRAAAAGADLVFLTEEDSTVEPTASILADLAGAARAAGARHLELIEDRRTAIGAAIAAARPGDLLLLAGKGGARKMDRPSGTIAWDEVAVARELLQAAGYNQGNEQR